MSEMPETALPHGWYFAMAGQCVDTQVGHAFKSMDFTGEGINLLRGDNIGHGELRWDENRRKCIDEAALDEHPNLHLAAGDIVLAMDRPVISTGLKIGKVHPPDLPALLVQRVLRLRPAIDRDYLYSALLSGDFIRHLQLEAKGGGVPHISEGQFKAYGFPVAPLPEQRRIVDELDSYLSRLDDTVATLERVQRNLKRYRASVLKAAVEGRLVPTEAELARQEGRDYETADVLLARILKERKARWIDQEAEKVRAKAEAKAKKAGNSWTKADDKAAHEKGRTTATKKYKEPEPPDTTELPELPEGWCWATVEQLGETVTGTTPPTSKSEYYGGDIAFFKPTDLNAGYCVSEARQYLTPAGLDHARLLPPNTVLVTCIGATIGKTGLATVQCATNQQINALVPESEVRATKYLYWFFASPVGFSAVVDNSSSTTLPILNKGRFEQLPVPLPPIKEQARIVSETDAALSVSESQELILSTSAVRCARLRQSILKWAFEGKLVDQDPNDEPASVLLDRIRTERDAAQAGAKKNGKPARPQKKTARKKKST